MLFESILNYHIVQVALILLVALLLHNLVSKVINRFLESAMRRHQKETKDDYKKRVDTVSHIFEAVAGVAIWVVASALILRVYDVNLASIAAGAGFLGIVIGLGAQATIRDYLAGIFILTENQYRVGDIITLSGGSVAGLASGVVEEITLRITKLRDLDGTLNIIRNGEASVITNRTFHYSSVVLDIGVSYDSDIDKVERIMNEVGRNMQNNDTTREDIIEPIQFLRVDKFADSAVVVKAVGKVSPAKQWEIGGLYRRELLSAFRREKIEIPYPQIVLHDKK